MKEYTIQWTETIKANTPEEAVRKALKVIKSNENIRFDIFIPGKGHWDSVESKNITLENN